MDTGAKLFKTFKQSSVSFRKIILAMEHMLSREIISRENSFEADAIMLIGVIYIEDLSCAQETGIESII